MNRHSGQGSTRKPDLFIVGAPKSGTTALYHFLREHPEIFMSHVKEPHFFSTDLQPPHSIRDDDKYLALFSQAQDHQRVGEASATYLYSSIAAKGIYDFCGPVSIIIMLRNPIDMIYALHSQRLQNGTETIVDFEAALNAEDDRRAGRLPAKGAFFLYREAAHYAPQIKRYYDVYGKDRVHIIVYDDFKTASEGSYRETLRFLGVNDTFSPNLRTINPNRQVRSLPLQSLLKQPPPFIRRLGEAIIHRNMGRRLIRAVLTLNSRRLPRPPLNEKLKRRLQVEFEPQIARLAQLTDLDLSRWMGG